MDTKERQIEILSKAFKKFGYVPNDDPDSAVLHSISNEYDKVFETMYGNGYSFEHARREAVKYVLKLVLLEEMVM